MQQMATESLLIAELENEIEQAQTQTIAILAGHLPLRVDEKKKELYMDYAVWGDFSTYTMALGAQIGAYARSLGKRVQFVLLVDDKIYRDDEKHLLVQDQEKSSTHLDRQWARARDSFYQKQSGDAAVVPSFFREPLGDFDFGIDDIRRHDHGKKGRFDSLFFSEAALITQYQKNEATAFERMHHCSSAYAGLLAGKHLRESNQLPYIIAFIPSKCQHYVCDTVDFFVDDFVGCHIFLDTQNQPTQDDFFQRGVFLKKNRGSTVATSIPKI